MKKSSADDLKFYIVDVFAEEKYAGNQLAVFRNAGSISTDLMQKIAFETNFSETTFILSDDATNGGWDVRIFTPTSELPFAGHPTLGTSAVIQQYILESELNGINLNLKVGQIPVEIERGNASDSIFTMKQINPEFGQVVSKKSVAKVLGLDMDDFVSSYPIQEVSTGIPFFVVPVKSRSSIRKINVNLQEYFLFVENYNSDNSEKLVPDIVSSSFMVFCSDPYDSNNDINVRMFDPKYSIPEDPATGSGNGCILAYLLKHDFFSNSVLNIRAEQGYEINRPSILYHMGAITNKSTYDINIGGKVQFVAEGLWYL